MLIGRARAAAVQDTAPVTTKFRTVHGAVQDWVSTQIQYQFWYFRPPIWYTMYLYKLSMLYSNARAGFGTSKHAKAAQVQLKKCTRTWLTLVSQSLVKFKKYFRLVDSDQK